MTPHLPSGDACIATAASARPPQSPAGECASEYVVHEGETRRALFVLVEGRVDNAAQSRSLSDAQPVTR